jgi:hypothetical protein
MPAADETLEQLIALRSRRISWAGQ